MAKKTVVIGLDESTNPPTIELSFMEVQNDGTVNQLTYSVNDIHEIILNEAEANELNGLPFFEFFPKKIPKLQWKVDFAAVATNPNPAIPSPFDEQTFLSDESESLSAGVNPDEPPDPVEDAPISAELNNGWATQVAVGEVWDFDFTVSFVNSTAQPITRRLRAKRR